MASLMEIIMSIEMEGRVEPILGGIGFCHSLGKKIDETNLKILCTATSADEIAVFVEAFNQLNFEKTTEETFLVPPKKGYKNPLIDSAQIYNEASLRTASNQYCMIAILSMAASMYVQFKKMTGGMEKELGTASTTEETLRPDAIEMVQTIGRRETFDPYLYTALLAIGLGNLEDIEKILTTEGITPDKKRIEEIYTLISNTDLPKMIKTQFAYVKSKGNSP